MDPIGYRDPIGYININSPINLDGPINLYFPINLHLSITFPIKSHWLLGWACPQGLFFSQKRRLFLEND